MRPLLLVVLSGCALYIAEPHPQDQPPPPPPVHTDPGPTFDMVRCEDSVVFGIDADRTYVPGGTMPGHGVGDRLTTCIAPCASSSAWCDSSGCDGAIANVCGAPASTGKTCELAGSDCQGSETIACPQSLSCAQTLTSASCTCTQGKYRCSELTPVAETQQALVGKWRGMVTPPSFAAPYEVSLWIYPDGTYWPEGGIDAAFYYGGDGPHPDRKISVLSVSPTAGASAEIGIFFGSSPASIGAITGLTVDATSLRFTYTDAWIDCTRQFTYVLARE